MAPQKKIYRQIKSVVEKHLPGSQVLLFGSHARGDADTGSDYDLLIVADKEYASRERITIGGTIMRELVYSLKAPFDILITSKNELAEKVQLPGHIMKTAAREGIEL